MEKKLHEKINNAPNEPGCYLWKDEFNKIIYVGKAKNIKNRIKQYFSSNASEKVKILSSKIFDLDFIVTKNENDALILERELIQKNKPKYNELLREVGNYPYIILTNENHPRLIYTKDFSKYKGKKYGPFAKVNSSHNKHEIFLLCNRLFPLRKCKTIPKKKCIYYDIGQCLGPCINKITDHDYEKIKKDIDLFFKGDITNIKNNLIDKEKKFALDLNFEQAKYFLDLQKSLSNIFDKNNININRHSNTYVVGYYSNNEILTIVIFNYFEGIIIDSYEESVFLIDDFEDEIVKILFNFFSNSDSQKKVFISLNQDNIDFLNNNIDNVEFAIPKKTEMKNAISLAAKNAAYKNANSNYNQINKTFTNQKGLDELSALLNIENLTLIEIYDNSNFFNEAKLAGKVAYWNGEKRKDLYRKYNIKGEIKSDYDMMLFSIKKRFSNITEGDLPNLIIVDGGIQQVNAAFKALSELGLSSIIDIIGLSKDDYHKTKSIITKDKEFILDKKSNLYSFLYEMQEEVHRYIISNHRKKRIDNFFKSELENIEGIGKKRINILMDNFNSLDDIRKASVKTISQFIPNNIAKKIYDHFRK